MPALAQDALSGGGVSTSKPLDSFHRLVHDINKVLGPSSGLDSQDVNPKDIEKLMDQYTSKESEWCQYAHEDRTRAYTRNLVDHGNGKCNLLILVWTPGKGSPIHDHANAHCIMKILRGSLQETLYTWPDHNLVNNNRPSPLKIKKETTYGKNQVTYMSDNLGLHKIVNTDPHNIAVSLHLYTPPNAAIGGCNLFDAETGKSSHVKQCYFYSEHGERCSSS